MTRMFVNPSFEVRGNSGLSVCKIPHLGVGRNSVPTLNGTRISVLAMISVLQRGLLF